MARPRDRQVRRLPAVVLLLFGNASDALGCALAEFSDATDVEQITRILTRLLLAAMLGGVLGCAREHQRKAAGIPDLSRVIQGVVAGIGFLGAGAIIKNRDDDVQGLTTAAGVWMTSAIGIACGLGRESTALLSTLLALIVLGGVPKLIDRDKR